MDPYRSANIVAPIQESKSTYRYVVHNSRSCPICELDCESTVPHRNSFQINWVSKPRGSVKHCHPLKRVVVRGQWFWKKYCPVEKIHFHCHCNECKISWIEFSANQFEPNYQERLL